MLLFLQGVSTSKLHFNILSTSALREQESHKNPSGVLFVSFFGFFSGGDQLAGRNGEFSPIRQVRTARPGAHATLPARR